ncbi:AfsR/SARP family transcriptional regulator [Streptomyces carminius]|uniref:AfsR/SARP family transcriptional regulator n=1 Tax=Streptomyces carminius TaxID=2665496 RepID=A0A2M8LTT5_9ACTN|nr:BTAD domain-containing putative transcriptional regulator [Streptomyces carminius]PJE95367.1 AfsR/SARP family transcriptional regulator [Streptomyces carminius]
MAELEFDLLGPLVVRQAGTAVDLGPPKRRALLIRLLLEDGRAVSLDRLSEDVWEGRPPSSAISSLQVHISRLRTVLEPRRRRRDRAEVLITEPTGYALHVPAESRDTVRFERAVARSRELLAGQRVREARREAERALAMWRGAALADAAHLLFAVREAARLEEIRLEALELHAAVLVHDGELRQAVAAAEELTARHPLRESGWSLLMHALYRSGRQAQALERYEELRRHLAGELGLEPGPELRAIQRAILHHDVPALARTLGHRVPPPARGPAPPAAGRSAGPDDPGAVPAGAADRDAENGETLRDGADGGYGPDPLPVTRPAQLPPELAHFAGRHTELAQALAPPGDGPDGTAFPVTVIGGLPGIGKTTLAIHWAHRIAGRFPDGQLFVNLRGFDPTGAAMEPDEALRGFLTALGVPPQRVPADLEAQAALYRSLLAGRRVLVLLDNARDEEQVRPLLPGVPGCAVVVTSRNQLSGLVATEGARPLSLGLPTEAEAREVVATRLGADRAAAEPRAVGDIVARCARLPLALAIVAARAALHPAFSLSSVAAELHALHGSLDAFTGADIATDVRGVFSWSYRALTPGAARLFRLLALHPGPDVSVPAAAGLAGLPVPETRPLLAELTRVCLLGEHAPGRFAFHDLLRVYAGELAGQEETEADRRAAVRRCLDHYLHTARSGVPLLNSQQPPLACDPPAAGVTPEKLTDHRRAIRWFTAENRVLNAVVKQSIDAGFDTHTRQLAWALQEYYDCKGQWSDSLTAHTAALKTAERRSDRAEQALFHRAIGRVHTSMGSYEGAMVHFDRAAELFTELGDVVEQARTDHSVAILFHRSGRDHAALRRAERVLELARSRGDRMWEAVSLNAVGWYRSVLGEHERALEGCRQSLMLLKGLDAPREEACVWDSLGHAHHHLGHHEEALICYRRALALFREFDDGRNEAGTLTRVGDTQRAMGDEGAARASWQRALEIRDELGRLGSEEIRARLADLAAPVTRRARERLVRHGDG